MQLRSELRFLGFPGEAKKFCEGVLDEFARLFPDDTDEGLLCEPTRKAIPICHAVRVRFRFDFPESLILRTLTNTRKAARHSA